MLQLLGSRSTAVARISVRRRHPSIYPGSFSWLRFSLLGKSCAANHQGTKATITSFWAPSSCLEFLVASQNVPKIQTVGTFPRTELMVAVSASLVRSITDSSLAFLREKFPFLHLLDTIVPASPYSSCKLQACGRPESGEPFPLRPVGRVFDSGTTVLQKRSSLVIL